MKKPARDAGEEHRKDTKRLLKEIIRDQGRHSAQLDRMEIAVARIDATLTEVRELVGQARSFRVETSYETDTSAADAAHSKEAAMPQTHPTTPVPANATAVIFKLVPLDARNRPKALNGVLTATTDQEPQPDNGTDGGAVSDQADPLALKVRFKRVADNSLDSAITIGDSDGDPSLSGTIDWDGSTEILEANQFGNVTVEFETA